MIPSPVISQVAVWKNHALQDYCCAMVEVGLNLLYSGVPYFGSDDVPESKQPESHAIPGTAASMLRHAGILTDFFGSIPEENIWQGRRKSKRKLANGRKINLFQLTSVSMAESYLNRNKISVEPAQVSLQF